MASAVYSKCYQLVLHSGPGKCHNIDRHTIHLSLLIGEIVIICFRFSHGTAVSSAYMPCIQESDVMEVDYHIGFNIIVWIQYMKNLCND